MILLCNHITKFLTDILIVVSAEFKSEIEWQMRVQNANPYWHLSPTQIDRIALEEVRAKAQG